MEVRDLFCVQFSVTDELSAANRRVLGMASSLVDTPLPRPNPDLSSEALANAHAARRRGISEARKLTLELLEPSSFDLQVLVVLFRAILESEQAGSLHLVLSLVARTLEDAWDGMTQRLNDTPAKDRERALRIHSRHVDLVFVRLYDVLARQKEQQGSDFELSSYQIEEGEKHWAGESWPELLERIDQALEARELRPAQWEHLRDRVGAFCTDAGATTVTTATVTQQAVPDSAPPSSSASNNDSAPPPISAVVVGASASGAANEASLRVSPKFWELLDRLKAFRWCLEQQDFEKAALVAADLEQRLKNFDVAGVFPDLFAEFFEGSAAYSEQLEHREVVNEVRAQSLVRLYETDLSRFLSLRPRTAAGPRPIGVGARTD